MEDIKLIHGDSLQALKGYADNHFKLAIVDPPYGLDKDLKGGKSGFSGSSLNGLVEKGWDIKPSKEYWTELFRVSENQIVWGGNYFLEHLRSTKCFISWDKMNGTNDMSDFELAWTSFDKGCRRFSMHHFSAGYDKKIHPTQKPTKLYKWLLENYTKEGDLILDTHLGSGSIAIACHYMKRKLIGYEIDKEYYDAACKRFKEQTSQQALW